jgi:DNA-binding MarR family transcriptional regulator
MSQEIRSSRENRDELVREVSREIRAAQNASDQLDEAFAEYLGVNRTDLRCLDIIDQHGRMTAGQLADESGLTTGAVTAVLDRLEGAGYVTRARDATDRRRVFVELTTEARRRAAEAYGPLAEATAEAFDRLPDRAIKTVREFLRTGRVINLDQAAQLRQRTLERAKRKRKAPGRVGGPREARP